MADAKFVAALKRGVAVWNAWHRRQPPGLRIDLSGARLSEIKLRGADLREVDLSEADLTGADLGRADLSEADLTGANLSVAILSGATLSVATLSRADLRAALLDGADLSGADLREADLRSASLVRATLIEATLGWADLSGAVLGFTVLGGLDLRDVKGLGSVHHSGPSAIDVTTLFRSDGRIPEVFLRGCGVPDVLITYMASLVGKPLDYHTCFISYSSADRSFAERLHADLQAQGVRCWFAPHDLKIGDRIRTGIDEAIRVYDKLLLVLSRRSIASQWVEAEVEQALAKERTLKTIVLFPIRLDDVILRQEDGWAKYLRNTRNIGDMRRWRDHNAYQTAFDRLLRDLRSEQPTPLVLSPPSPPSASSDPSSLQR